MNNNQENGSTEQNNKNDNNKIKVTYQKILAWVGLFLSAVMPIGGLALSCISYFMIPETDSEYQEIRNLSLIGMSISAMLVIVDFLTSII